MRRAWRIHLTTIVAFSVLPIGAQDQAPQIEPVANVSVCDLLADPIKYQGRLISVRGIVQGTDEGTWLAPANACEKPFVTYGFTWPEFLWLEVADNPSVVSRVGFHTDIAASLKIDRQARKMKLDYEKDRVWLTYIGVFETRDYKPSDVGIDRAYGFGHLGSAPGQVVIKTVKDFHVERNYRHD